jgi:endoglucanase
LWVPRGRLALCRTAVVAVVAATALAALPAFAGDSAGTRTAGTRTAGTDAPTSARQDPRRTRGLFVDPKMPAAQAGSEFARIGRKAQALWITDYYPTSTVQSAVRDYTSRANAADKTPMLAIYAIPDRDCGLYSAGGFATYPEYRAWIRQVAKGAKNQQAIVVLEPDAVPFMGDPRCTDAGPRQDALAYAAKLLRDAGAWVYLDAGHSGWRSPEEMATLLKKSGLRYARGFSTNVGNYRHTADEITYARTLAGRLKDLGLTGLHYVIETARNGADGDPVDGDVCNPTWARIGAPPQLLFQHRLDGLLWIKHPGESDGPCNGGPASGEWWPDGARRLMAPG